jgi:hypothetical protein
VSATHDADKPTRSERIGQSSDLQIPRNLPAHVFASGMPVCFLSDPLPSRGADRKIMSDSSTLKMRRPASDYATSTGTGASAKKVSQMPEIAASSIV